MKHMIKSAGIIFLACCAGLASCKKLLDAPPKDVLTEENMYRNVSDADAAVIGVYGKFMNLADRYVLLNELRADLLTVTPGANEYLRQLDAHNVGDGNPWANPKPFYEVIMNCNDVLRNLNVMVYDKKLKVDEYNQRYADIVALRCWLYLQLGIQFGRVPYITEALTDANGMDKINNAPRIPLTTLVDTLITQIKGLPYWQPYPSTASLFTVVDGYTTSKFFINKYIVAGQLYLWKGAYRDAALMFKTVMETGGTGDLKTYRLSGASVGDHSDLAVWYTRYREVDEASLIDNNSQGWRSIFARSEDPIFHSEWIWYLPFNKSFKPVDPFIDLFSNRGGSYLVKPSQSAINNWNSQTQRNDFTYDARGKKFSWRSLDGQPVVMKYLYNYLNESTLMPTNLFEKNGRWFLYRAASLHLDYAEAANRDSHQPIASLLLNQGLTLLPGKITNEPPPYNFDARKSDNPSIAADWCYNAGIRGRANLYSVVTSGADSIRTTEDALINEAALELAYEGRRWSDLVRIALRRNDPAFLADKIYNKLVAENNPNATAVRNKLMNPENWWLPFKWQ